MELIFSRRRFGGKPLDFSNAPSLEASYLCVTLPRPGGPCNGAPVAQRDWVNRVVSSSQNGRVLIVVHGYNVQQRSFIYNMSTIRKTLVKADFGGGVVGFDWPSDGNFLRYWTDRKDAEFTANSLVNDCIIPLLRRKPGLQVSILAHSMGSFVVARALQKAAHGKHLPEVRKAIKEVVFTSPEINQAHFKAGGWALKAFQKYNFRLTNYWSHADDVLRDREGWFAKRTKRLGRHKSPLKPDKLHDAVDCTAHYKKAYKKTGTYRKSHSFYYEDRIFYTDLLATLSGASRTNRPFRKPGPDGHQLLG